MSKKMIVYLVGALLLIALVAGSMMQNSTPMVEYKENGGEWKAVNAEMIERSDISEGTVIAVAVENHSQIYFRANKTLQLSFGIVENVVPYSFEVGNMTVRINKGGEYKVLIPCKEDITSAGMVRFTHFSDYEMVPVHDFEFEEECRAQGMKITEENYQPNWIGSAGNVTEVISRYEGRDSNVTKMKVSPDSNAITMSLDVASRDAPVTVEVYNLDISHEEEPARHFILGFEARSPGSYHDVYLPKVNMTSRPHIQVCLYREEKPRVIFMKNYTLVGNEYHEID